MRAICGRGKDWALSSDCDICGKLLNRRYINKPGVGSYREKGLFCAEHGIMIPEHVVYRQNQNSTGRFDQYYMSNG